MLGSGSTLASAPWSKERSLKPLKMLEFIVSFKGSDRMSGKVPVLPPCYPVLFLQEQPNCCEQV